MNTTDINLDDVEIPWQEAAPVGGAAEGPIDRLLTLIVAQHQLTMTYLPIEERNGCVVVHPDQFGDLDDRQVQMRLKDLAQRTIEEICEATNVLKNKPWKNNFTPTDRAHYLEEISDALHFFLEWVMVAVSDDPQVVTEFLFGIFFKKHEVNRFRQRTNY